MKALLVLTSLFMVASPARSQVDPLEEVESLSVQGRIREARELLMVWWEHRSPEANRGELQRAIWLRGKLTVDPSLAEVDFRRLVVEYPGGAYSDDARFRLGLLGVLRRDTLEAIRQLTALRRDFPDTPLRNRTLAWLAELGAEGVQAPPRPAPAEVEATLSVQLGAFEDPARARALAGELEDLGYSPRLVRVPESGLVRVRIGRYSHREGADALARELRERGFECTLSSDAHRESAVG